MKRKRALIGLGVGLLCSAFIVTLPIFGADTDTDGVKTLLDVQQIIRQSLASNSTPYKVSDGMGYKNTSQAEIGSSADQDDLVATNYTNEYANSIVDSVSDTDTTSDDTSSVSDGSDFGNGDTVISKRFSILDNILLGDSTQPANQTSSGTQLKNDSEDNISIVTKPKDEVPKYNAVLGGYWYTGNNMPFVDKASKDKSLSTIGDLNYSKNKAMYDGLDIVSKEKVFSGLNIADNPYNVAQNYSGNNMAVVDRKSDGSLIVHYASANELAKIKATCAGNSISGMNKVPLISGKLTIYPKETTVTTALCAKYIPRYINNANNVTLTNPAFPNEMHGNIIQSYGLTPVSGAVFYNNFINRTSDWGNAGKYITNYLSYYDSRLNAKASIFNQVIGCPGYITANSPLINNFKVLQDNTTVNGFTPQPVIAVQLSTGNYITVFSNKNSSSSSQGDFSIVGTPTITVGKRNESIAKAIVDAKVKDTGNSGDNTGVSADWIGREVTVNFMTKFDPPKNGANTIYSKLGNRVLVSLVLNNTLAPGRSDSTDSLDNHTAVFKFSQEKTTTQSMSIKFEVNSIQELNSIKNIGVMVNPYTAVQNKFSSYYSGSVPMQANPENTTDNNTAYVKLKANTPDFVISGMQYTNPKTGKIELYPNKDKYSLVLPAGETKIQTKVWVDNTRKLANGNYNVTVDGKLSMESEKLGDTAVLNRSVSIGNVNYNLDGLFEGKVRPSGLADYSKLNSADDPTDTDNSTVLYNNSESTLSKLFPGFIKSRLIKLPSKTAYIKAGYFLRLDDGTFDYNASYDVRKDSHDFFHASALKTSTDERQQQTRIDAFNKDVTSKLFSTSLVTDFKKSGIGLPLDGKGNPISTEAQDPETFQLMGDPYKVANGSAIVTSFNDISPETSGVLSTTAVDDSSNDVQNLEAVKDQPYVPCTIQAGRNTTLTPITLTFNLPSASTVDRAVIINYNVSQVFGNNDQSEGFNLKSEQDDDKFNNNLQMTMKLNRQTSTNPSGINIDNDNNTVSWTNTKSESDYGSQKDYDYNTVNGNDPTQDYKNTVQLNKNYQVFWRYPLNRSAISADTNSDNWRKAQYGPYQGKVVNQPLRVYSEKSDNEVGAFPDYTVKQLRDQTDPNSATQRAVKDGASDVEWLVAQNDQRTANNQADLNWWYSTFYAHYDSDGDYIGTYSDYPRPIPRPLISPTSTGTFNGNGSGLTDSYYPTDIRKNMNDISIFYSGLFQTNYTEYYHSIYSLVYSYKNVMFGLAPSPLSKDYYNVGDKDTGTDQDRYDTILKHSHPFTEYLNDERSDRDDDQYFWSAKFYIDPHEKNNDTTTPYHFLPALIQAIPITQTYQDGSKIVDTKDGTPSTQIPAKIQPGTAGVANLIFNINIDGTATDDIHQSSGVEVTNDSNN